MEKIKVTSVRKTESINILKGIGLPGTWLPPHTADQEVQLIMTSGQILFNLAENAFHLYSGDCQVIPANELHSLKVLKNCQFFLVMPNNTKMKFSPKSELS